MKNLFYTLVLLFLGFSISNVQAQEPTFSQGDKVVNIGVGLGSTLYSGSGYKSSLPPLSVSFEYGFKDGIANKGSIGLGGYLGYASSKWETELLGDTWGYKYSSIIVGARGSFHYPFLDKLDSYAGLMIGYNIVSAKETGSFPTIGTADSASSGLSYSFYLGGRYYFTENIGAMLELGYGISYLNLGVAIKL